MVEKLSAQWRDLRADISVRDLFSILILCAFLGGIFLFLRDSISLMRATTAKYDKRFDVIQRTMEGNTRLLSLLLLPDKQRETLLASEGVRREVWRLFGGKHDFDGPDEWLREQKPPKNPPDW